ncbi:MAG TPA: elongation factor G [Verrucomicrobiota bacterium]|nr:elongation factor G [Verrucomicrobiota bacterium]HRT55304.1 elongation factor G [Candidatus Paceibacterota bacterium]
MKEYQAAEIRNFAIVGHASCGKTMLSEAMLACAGVINRMGSIAAGSTVSDYHDSEQQRQISVSATLMHLEWLNKKFNLIDCPGYADFMGESLGALRVSDFALITVHANHGVGVGTDAAWKYATQNGIPKMIVVNAFDKEETDFEKTLAQIREHFGERVFPLTLPVNPGPGFNQVLDVPRSELITFAGDRSGKYTEAAASGPWADRAKALHSQLIEFIAESDDALMEKFFAQGGLSEEEMRAGLHAAIQKQVFTPLFVTSAENNIGVARLMDFIAKYGSSPADRPKVTGQDPDGKEVEVALTDPDPVLYIFKTMSEAQFGELSFFRVYSGSIKFGTELTNTSRRSTEKIGQIYILNGKTRTSVPSLNAGDLGAVVKLKDTHTGDTLCGGKRMVILPKVEYPKPNIHAALKSSVKGEEDKIASGLAALHHEDPTFLYMVDAELRQTIVSAQGELHLEVIADRLRKRFNVHVELVEPRVRYRETIKGRGESKYRHKKQTGGAGQFAEVWMRIEPKPRDTGVEFTQSLTGQNVDRVFVPSVEKGVMKACEEGILAGYRVVDVKIDFYDGKMHPVDSKDIAFQIAGYFGFKECFNAARPCLLEPIHLVEIRIPEDCMGKVMGDLSSRRGKIQGMDMDGGFQVIRAHVPAKELYRYSSTLRSLTGGRGVHTESFSHYEEMPRDAEAKVIEESKKAKAQQEAE